MTPWVWLDERDARIIHERLLTLHGGAEGVRGAGLLESALARPQQLAAYGDNLDVSDLFIDGNKRTGFVLGILFLEINGMRFTASEESAAQATLDLAAGNMDMIGYATFLRENIT
jgi:death-on-curing protein